MTAYPVVIETPNNPEPRLILWPARCCRTWEIAIGNPIGRCGYCGQRPVLYG